MLDNYVEKAKKAAELRKKEEAKERKKQEDRSKSIQKDLKKFYSLLKEGLSQWDGVVGLKYESLRDDSYVLKDSMDKNVIEVYAAWGHSTKTYSDDCHIDYDGPEFRLTMWPRKTCGLYNSSANRQTYVGDTPEESAKYCLEKIADFISRELM